MPSRNDSDMWNVVESDVGKGKLRPLFEFTRFRAARLAGPQEISEGHLSEWPPTGLSSNYTLLYLNSP